MYLSVQRGGGGLAKALPSTSGVPFQVPLCGRLVSSRPQTTCADEGNANGWLDHDATPDAALPVFRASSDAG